MIIFFDTAPFNQVLSTLGILVSMAAAFMLGWFVSWWITTDKISELRYKIGLHVHQLNDCRRINGSLWAQTALRPVKYYQDDLKLVEGIGPKIETLLNSNGILTFDDLAEVELAELLEILRKAGNGFQSYDPSTWPLQSSLARDGKWEQLDDLQIRLDWGRKA